MIRLIQPVKLNSAFFIRYHSTSNNHPPADQIKSSDLPPLLPSEPLPDTEYLRESFPSLDAISPEALTARNSEGKTVQLPKNWYYISRTASDQLPIYHDIKSAGTIDTIIRRIEGDASQLRNDLMEQLELTKKKIRIKAASNQIVIRGKLREQVKEILEKYF